MFNQIIIPKKSLIVMDIDDTVIKYDSINKKWWVDTFNKYFKINDYDKSDQLTLIEWENKIIDEMPKYTNEEQFKSFVENALNNNCTLIFLTARNEYLNEITKKHFDYLNIPNHFEIYYCNGTDKGLYLKNLYNTKYNNFNNIIFIDDLQQNIEDVYLHLNDLVSLKCYLYQ